MRCPLIFFLAATPNTELSKNQSLNCLEQIAVITRPRSSAGIGGPTVADRPKTGLSRVELGAPKRGIAVPERGLVANFSAIREYFQRQMNQIVTDDCKRTNDDLEVSAPRGAAAMMMEVLHCTPWGEASH